MSDYIIIKGKNQTWAEAQKSTNIDGLLIIPSKVERPRRRVEIEQIDGRDGDIITDLGYSAYDKSMVVGLYGKYDIDDVMDFFKLSGHVIFSNEPYCYYDYEIIDESVLNRVIRFQRGVVTFHVQPFKHSAVDGVADLFNTNGIVVNNGNVSAKPVITISGSGETSLYINGALAFTADLRDDGYMVIDSEQMEAYKGDDLKNRQIICDYDNVALKRGKNKITWTGNVTGVVMYQYSRWI